MQQWKPTVKRFNLSGRNIFTVTPREVSPPLPLYPGFKEFLSYLMIRYFLNKKFFPLVIWMTQIQLSSSLKFLHYYLNKYLFLKFNYIAGMEVRMKEVCSIYMQWTECLCPLQIHILKPNPHCDGMDFSRWLGHESGAPMNGISALIKGTPQSSLTPFSPWGHSEKMCLGTRKGALTRPSWHPAPGLPNPQSHEK